MRTVCLIVMLLFLAMAVGTNSSKYCEQGSVLIKEQCIQCQILANTISSSITKNNTCLCKTGYKWQQKSKECIPKTTSTPPKFPKKTPPSNINNFKINSKIVISKFEGICNQQMGFIIKNNTCLNCKAITNTIGIAIGNTSCLCQQDLLWWEFHQVCICWYKIVNQISQRTYFNSGNCRLCSTIINETQANFCRLCQGGSYGASRMGCHNCSSIPNTIGASMSHSIYGNQYGECICKAGYRFSFRLGQCICDSGFYMDGTTCQNCSKLSTKLLIASCNSCSNPYIYDSYAQVCKMAKLITNFDTASYMCKSGYSFKVDPNDFMIIGCFCSYIQGRVVYQGNCITCQDIQNIIPNSDICNYCDNANGFHQGLVECIYCFGVAHSTGQATVDGCSCQENYFWNQITVQCECDLTMGFYTLTGGVCFNCNQIENTMLPAFKTQCRCLNGYIWNNAKKICQCNIKGGKAFLYQSQCISCEGMVGSTEQAKTNMCICNSIYFWNPLSLVCQCNNQLSFISSYINFCINCLFVKNSNGFGFQFGCSCKNGYLWNATSLSCDCGINYFVNGQHCFECSSKFSYQSPINIDSCLNCSSDFGFAMSDGICYLCSSQANSLGLASSQQCLCRNWRNIWVPSYGACVCNSYHESLSNYAKGQVTCQYTPWPYNNCNASVGQAQQNISSNLKICSICTSIPYSNKKAIGSQCACIPGYKWNTNNYPFSCTCSISNGGYKNGSACANCSALKTTGSLTKSGCIACDFNQGFLFDKLNDACILCSSIPHTDGTATLKGCSCNLGWAWNPSNFTCVINPCTGNYIYNPLWKQCECDFTIAIQDSSNNCVRCDSYSNSDGIPTSIASCGCKQGYQWSNLFNSQNSESRCICPSCHCSDTSFVLGDLNGAEVCFECGTVSDYAGVNKETSQCTCIGILVWNWNPITLTGTCSCNNSLLISINNGAQCICNPSISLVKDGSCFDCRNILGGINQNGLISIVDESTDIPSCKCKQNFKWNSQNFNCDCIEPFALIDATSECNCNYPLIFNGIDACICDQNTSIILSDGSCLSCSSVLNSAGFVSTSRLNTCLCISNLIFTMIDDFSAECNCGTTMRLSLNETKCISLFQNYTYLNCDGSQGFVQVNGQCLNCLLFKYSNGQIYSNTLCQPRSSFILDPQIGQIKCKEGQFLNGLKCQSCNYQINTINKINCIKVYPPFGYSLSGVINCSTLQFSAGSSNYRCICQKGYYFNYKTTECQCDFYQGYFFNGTQCLDCKKGTATIINNCLTCSPPYYFDNQVCLLGKFLPNLNVSSPTLECQKGYDLKKNPITNKILSCACSAAQRYYLNGSICSPCTSIINFDTIYIEYCEGCNNEFGFYKGLVQCIQCSGILHSTGSATKEGCICQSTYFWNAITAKCECDFNLGYFNFNQKCISCKKIPNTELPALSNSCLCKKGYIWTAASQTCNCDVSGGYFGNIGQCITCLTILNTADKTKKNNACICKQGSVWDANLNKCGCDFSKNFAQFINGCANCTDIANSLGSASIFGCVCQVGFIWSYSLGLCHCSYGYYRTQNDCIKCSHILPSSSYLQLCETCNNIEGGYVLNRDICYHCQSLGSNKFVSNERNYINQCNCLDPMTQYWDANLGRCVCNIYSFYFPVVDQNNGLINCIYCQPLSCSSEECNNLKNIYYNYKSNACKNCSEVNVQPIDYYASYSFNYECQCKPGQSINYKVYPYTCTCDFNQGYYLDGSQCLNCRSLPSTGKITNLGCLACNNTQGFYLDAYNKICIKCKGIYGSNGLAHPTGCGCTNQYWDAFLNICNDTTCHEPFIFFNPTNFQYHCDCNPKISMRSENEIGCLYCAQLTKGIGRTIYSPIYSKFVCQCSKGHIYGVNPFTGLFDCVCQYPLIYDQQGICSCNTTVSLTIGLLQCYQCSNIGPLGTGLTDQYNQQNCQCQLGYQFKWNSTTKIGSCQCPTGYKLDYNGIDCICDPLISIEIDGTCTPCAKIYFSNNKSSNGGLSCGCISPFQWYQSYNNCSCNSSAVYAFDSKQNGVCIICSANIFAISKQTQSTCYCKQGLQWRNGFCQCDYQSAMVITGISTGKTYKCVVCNGSINAILKFNRTTCQCLPTLIWQSNKCGCTVNDLSVTVDGLPKCITCNASIFAKSKSATKPICICVSTSFVWDSTVNSCVCISKQSVSFKQGNSYLCISCSTPINANGRLSPTECGCITQQYIWSPLDGKCICANNYSVLVNGTRCVACDSSVNANGTFNLTACKCQPKILVWQSIGMCDCNSTSVLFIDQFGVVSCITCNASVQAISKLNSTACKCKTGFEWRNKTCVCPQGTINTYTTALTCFDCKNIYKETIDAFNCLCSEPKIWDNIKKLCVSCGTTAVPKSTYNSVGLIACECVTGSIWDVMTNSCIKDCTSSPTICMNCKKIPNSNTTKLPVLGNQNSYRNIIGGQIIMQAYRRIYTNYDAFPGYSCVCSTGFSWDDYRKRCLSNSIPIN